MTKVVFPMPIATIVRTLARIYRYQSKTEMVDILETAHATVEYDGYDANDGGTDLWVMRLDVPISLFASIEPRLNAIEEAITGTVGYVNRTLIGNALTRVLICPTPEESTSLLQVTIPADADVDRIWTKGAFRLFISHVATHKASAAALKSELAQYGICAFVAHDDIEPIREWRDEIELALNSMHALAALITSDFHASNWTDQEVGWAMGRGALVVPVRIDAVPYGFAAKFQAVPGVLKDHVPLAHSIAKTLCSNPQSHREMKAALVQAFITSRSYGVSITLKNIIIGIADFTAEQKAALLKACDENSQVRGAYSVAVAVKGAFGPPPVAAATDDDVPF